MTSTYSRIVNMFHNLPLYIRVYGYRGVVSFARLRYSSGSAVLPMYLRGMDVPLYVRADTTDGGVMREVFLDRDYDVEVDFEPRVIVDAGANVGFTSIFYALKYPQARVYAIEPELANFTLLKRNVVSCNRIVPIYGALWSESKLIQLVDPGRGSHGFVTQDYAGVEAIGDESVQAFSIPDLMERFHLSSIDILKLDIEGAEKEVLETAGVWIDRVGLLIAELHERLKPGCDAAFWSATNGMSTVYQRGKLVACVNPHWAT